MVSVSSAPTRRMVALPPRGLRARGTTADNSVKSVLLSLHSRLLSGNVPISSISTAALNVGTLGSSNPTMRVLGSIAENGAKLIEYQPGEESAVRAALPGLRLVPEVFYEPMSVRLSLESNLQPSGSGHDVQVTVRSTKNGKPIPRVKIVGFTNFALRAGAEAITNAKGMATLKFGAKPGALERLYAFAERGFWSGLLMPASTSSPIQIDLAPIDLGQPHALRHYFGEPALTAGAGVNVGVIDTGSGPHPDLVITNGFNAVTGENPQQFGDNGDLHGTHVAGIIASRGGAPTGVRGVAPGVNLFSYRVFAKGANASNFDIANAIDKAREQGCDLINLSLGRPAGPSAPDEPLVRIAVEDAREAGMLAIAAAGNDFRRGVSFPGADELCLAVSALGNKTILAIGSVSASAAAPPPGTDPDESIGDFSNVGPEVDVAGPGVGVVSTVPQTDFTVMDGTSMACPAVTGVAARLLASKPGILAMSRDSSRATAIADAVLTTARSRGFTPALEGRGLPQ
jgi:subtilisin